MGRKFFNLVLLLGAVAGMTGCLDHDNEDHSDISTDVTNNLYVVNAGNFSSGIGGTLSIVDLTDTFYVPADSMFRAVNNRSLGMNPNDALIFGTKMYIAVSGENTIEVVDKNTLESLAQLNTTDMLGAELGLEPRRLTSAFGKVYFSTYGGCVASIDTTSFALQKVYEVGSCPEAMVATSSYLYVGNTDDGRGDSASITKIDLRTNDMTNFRTNVHNPKDMAICNDLVFVLDGSSEKRGCDSLAVINGNEIGHIMKADFMASLNNDDDFTPKLFLATYDLEGDSVKYQSYRPNGITNPTGGLTSTFISGGPKHPAAIAVDQYTGYVYVAAYNETSTGTADYSRVGYVNIYDTDGALVKQKIRTGVGPTRIAFNRVTKYY